MTDTSSNNRPTLFIALVAMAILAAGAAYLFWPSASEGPARGDKAAYATKNAEAAIAAAGMSSKDRAATEAIVRAYILEHPEIITEAVEILQRREMEKRVGAAGSTLTKPFAGAIGGNPSGKTTIVEFTDYNCGFCRASLADVERLTKSDSDIRIVYRELPILSPSSRDAARWALAAAKQGKHKAFHDALFASGPVSDQTIRSAALKAGLNMVQAEKDAASAEVNAEIESNLAMMQQIGFGGTPTFFIGDQMIEGAVGYETLKAAIEKARKKS